MKRSKLVVQSLTALVLAGSSITAMAADTGWYAGVGVGSAQAKDLVSAAEFDADLLADYGITATSTIDDSDTAWKLFAGYRFNKNLAVEGGYADLGKATFDSIVTSGGGGRVSASWGAKAWSLAAVGILPVTDQFEVFGKIGGYFYNADLSATGSGGGGTVSVSVDDDGTGLLFGVGASYSFTKNIAVRAEWERYKDVGDENAIGTSDVDMLSVGIQYKF
ncbi:MAG: outer membrane beta-barrel protein [Pseudomonadota bacterium]|nr:outer membrane beta-barrel protein [Pseudomonadota bacterium]